MQLTLNKDVSATSFDLSGTAATTLILATGYTNDTTVKVGATGADVVTNSTTIGLTINGTGTAMAAAGNLTGGTGTDTVNVTADSAAANYELSATTLPLW